MRRRQTESPHQSCPRLPAELIWPEEDAVRVVEEQRCAELPEKSGSLASQLTIRDSTRTAPHCTAPHHRQRQRQQRHSRCGRAARAERSKGIGNATVVEKKTNDTWVLADAPKTASHRGRRRLQKRPRSA